MITVSGLLLVPLPGPGWAVVIVGLAILATEFAWARHLLEFIRDRLRMWTRWLGRQGWTVRVAVGLGTALCVGLTLWAVFAMAGVPEYLPDWLVPPLPGLDRA